MYFLGGCHAIGIFQVPINYESESTYEDSTITDPKEREKHFWQKDHLRLYGKDYPIKLEKAGFKIEIFNPRTDLKKLNYQKLMFLIFFSFLLNNLSKFWRNSYQIDINTHDF